MQTAIREAIMTIKGTFLEIELAILYEKDVF